MARHQSDDVVHQAPSHGYAASRSDTNGHDEPVPQLDDRDTTLTPASRPPARSESLPMSTPSSKASAISATEDTLPPAASASLEPPTEPTSRAAKRESRLNFPDETKQHILNMQNQAPDPASAHFAPPLPNVATVSPMNFDTTFSHSQQPMVQDTKTPTQSSVTGFVAPPPPPPLPNRVPVESDEEFSADGHSSTVYSPAESNSRQGLPTIIRNAPSIPSLNKHANAMSLQTASLHSSMQEDTASFDGSPIATSPTTSTMSTPPPPPRMQRTDSQQTTTTTSLPKLTTFDLGTAIITVPLSHIRANDRGKEVLSFVIEIALDPMSEREGWKIEKLYSDVLALDAKVRQSLGRTALKRIAPLPDAKLFKDHAPAKVDQRKRSNSELGHYPDMAPPPTKKFNRASYHPSAQQHQERAPSPDKVKISGPINGAPIPAGHRFGDAPPIGNDRERKAKSGRFWGFGKAASDKPLPAPQAPASRAVFGIALQDSLAIAQIANLPAIVFRCIEYLEAKRADQEEGIYRLSGSSAVIKSLKDKFNAEGDVNLLESEEYWDPHAVAGLLKSYLRELPSSILTRDLHLNFLAVIDLADPQERVSELASLISQLPLANYSLLRALTAHLILIVQNSNVNKMTMRNVGIVFSPTLGIPAGVFSLMLNEFNRVFSVEAEGASAPVEEAAAVPSAPDPSASASARGKRGTSDPSILFICFNVDHKVLYAAPLTDKIVDDGFEFYTTFYNAPGAVKALLHAMMGVGILGLVAKLHIWDESALFFDGTSLGA
ncbi:hypothetical protein FRC11_007720 [Ceratobasidium sp. 423]|nr:hypothetical protein FRC11_007720 [Ceratobasidium sp. 423]